VKTLHESDMKIFHRYGASSESTLPLFVLSVPRTAVKKFRVYVLVNQQSNDLLFLLFDGYTVRGPIYT
jgi:hypothetical protein